MLIGCQVVELAVKVSSSPVNVAMIVAFCALRVSAPGQRKRRTLAAHQREIQQPADCYSAGPEGAVDGWRGQHHRTIKMWRWRPLVPARATPSPGE
jgi:hypothetical protein